ncbi:PRC-barrel domain-containing protein [Paenalcaligenes niemegkensis]|uniref:PRC-barrel domain-containing protein n=1 Tax=Paenalcaligenes niemegkensis TaxID=2895469 RepID=UPI001EE8056A|nr:PRC-barrel domain-containing protein [Paenalcaligenes niemegkensis]MCQ9617040.1 PRC-barrel domain-containing protein [Paenalcaligenes niemegkensis]
MKKILITALCSLPLALAPLSYAQDNAAGSGAAGAGPASSSDSATMSTPGTDWSVKSDVIGQSVYNEDDEKVGNITDITMSADGAMTSFIVGAGGFLGMGEHNVAIPFDEITENGGKFMLSGYTKDRLKDMPAYEPPKSDEPMDSDTMGSPAASGSMGAPAAPGAAPADPAAPGAPTAPGASSTQ